MAKARSRDIFPNRAVQRLTMSGANAITFAQIRFGLGVFQGVALILHRVEFWPDATSLRELVSTTDQLVVGLTNRDDLTSLSPTNLNVLVQKTMTASIVGAVVSLEILKTPLVQDFSTQPGGGMIIPANPLYLGMATSGAAAASMVDCCVYYTFKSLSDADYIELVQGMLPANI